MVIILHFEERLAKIEEFACSFYVGGLHLLQQARYQVAVFEAVGKGLAQGDRLLLSIDFVAWIIIEF